MGTGFRSLLAVAAALAVGCWPGEEGSRDASPDLRSFQGFLDAAEVALERRPEPVRPAVVGPTEPSYAVLRLDAPERRAAARVRSGWEETPAVARPLATAGPVSGRAGSGGPSVVERGGRRVVALRARGFAVERSEVAALELTLAVPWGRHVVLRWSQRGHLMVPVQDHDGPFTVRLSTAGLAEWQGPLESLEVETDGLGEGEVTLEQVVFLSGSDAHPGAFGFSRARQGAEIRSALYARVPSEVRFDAIPVPIEGRLGFGLGAAEPTAGVAVSVEVIHARGRDRVARAEADATGDWRDTSVSLAEWAGQTVSLSFHFEGPGERVGSEGSPGALAFVSNPVVYAPSPDPPVLVLYLIDTLASAHVDLYGYPRATMPTLAALASRGVWFSEMRANSARTLESVPDLMLSMTAERHGVRSDYERVPDELVTLAEALRARGFATASFVTNVFAGPRSHLDQGFDVFVDRIGYSTPSAAGRDGGDVADRTVPLEEVLSWLAEHRDRPAFVYVHTAEPHVPYQPPAPWAGSFDRDYAGDVDGTYDPQRGFKTIGDAVGQARDLAHVVALYDEEVRYADAQLGRLLERLADDGLDPNVVVTSDHGESFLEHGVFEHGLDLHGEQVRVPWVAAGPLVAARGRIDVPAQILDVMPTLLDLLGVPAPYPLAGRSLARWLRASPAAAPPAAVDGQARAGFRSPGDADVLFGSNHFFVRSGGPVEYYALAGGRWKLIRSARSGTRGPGGLRSRFQLYDLENDPAEQRSLLYEERAVARELLEALVEWRADQRPFAVEGGVDRMQPADLEQLRALGYLR